MNSKDKTQVDQLHFEALSKIKIFTMKMKEMKIFITGAVITPKHVTSGEAHLRGSAPGQHSSEKTLQRWRAVGDSVFDSTSPGIVPQTYSDVFIHYANWPVT